MILNHYTYILKVNETGLYALSFKYLQNTLKGLVVMKNIYLERKIPFSEFAGYAFPDSSRWANHTLQDKDGNPYYIYLEADHEYNLTIETSLFKYNALINFKI